MDKKKLEFRRVWTINPIPFTANDQVNEEAENYHSNAISSAGGRASTWATASGGTRSVKRHSSPAGKQCTGAGGCLASPSGFHSSVCGTPTNEWRHMARVSWVTPWDVDVSLGWRYYSGVTGLAAANVELPAANIDREIPAENYFDLSANWAVTEKASVTLGINNVLDDNPTLSSNVGTTGNGNTYPQTYDALGRYVFLRATVSF